MIPNTNGTGYRQITSLSGAVGLSGIPAGSEKVLIQAESQDVRWRDDGTNPTTTVGMLLANGDLMEYDGDLNSIKFIEVTGSAKLNCYFSKAHA